MSTVLLHDFHNLAFRTLFLKDVKINSKNPNYDLWKYIIFNNIYMSMFKNKNVKEIILAFDDSKSWRKLFWPRYKEHRKLNRDKSDINWDILFEHLRGFFNDLKMLTPFKALHVKNCEGDDIIAVIAQNADPDKNYVIISTDEDYTQLIKSNVIVYNPPKKKYLKTKNKEYLDRLFLKGQGKDFIFSVVMPDDFPCGLLGTRRKPSFGNKKINEIMHYGIDKWLKENQFKYQYKFQYMDLNGNTQTYECKNNDILKNYKRNMVLLSFDKIPKEIIKRILNTYREPQPSLPELLYELWKKYDWPMDYFDKVNDKLLELY